MPDTDKPMAVQVTITNHMRGPRGFQHVDSHRAEIIGTEASATLNVAETDLPMLQEMHRRKEISLSPGAPEAEPAAPAPRATPPRVDPRKRDKIAREAAVNAASIAAHAEAERLKAAGGAEGDDDDDTPEPNPALAFLFGKGLTDDDVEGMSDEEIEQRAVGLGYEPAEDDDAADQGGDQGEGAGGDDDDVDAPMDFDAMAKEADGEKQIRLYIETKTGTAPHPNKKMKGLLDQAKAIQTAERGAA